MSNDLNRCEFIGRVGTIETRFTPSGDAVTNISLACGSQWKDKNTGQKQESTEWIRITVFGPLAKIAQDYVNKGQQLYISGKWKTRKWQDKKGQDRYTTEIVVDSFNGVMQMLGSRSDSSQENPHAQKNDYSGPHKQQAANNQQRVDEPFDDSDLHF